MEQTITIKATGKVSQKAIDAVEKHKRLAAENRDRKIAAMINFNRHNMVERGGI